MENFSRYPEPLPQTCAAVDTQPPEDNSGAEDAALVQQTLQGQTEAFGQLFQKYQARLYRAMVCVAGNADDASDAVQEAFLRALVHLDTLRQRETFYAWLYRIGYRAVGRLQCRRVRMRVSIDDPRDSWSIQPHDDLPGPDEQLDQRERCQRIMDAIAGLSVPRRALVELHVASGCSYEKAARLLRLPVGTVRSRLHRARADLCRRLRLEPTGRST